MVHLFFLAEGLPEGLEVMEREFHNRSFGNGRVKLRPVKLYNLQCPEEDLPKVMQEFRTKGYGEMKFKDGFNKKFEHKEAPFKRGLLLRVLHFAVGFAGVFGFKPFKPWEYVKEWKEPKVNKPACNLFPLAILPDNHYTVKSKGKRKEWL